MDILLQALGGIAGILLLYYGADMLIRGGVSIAAKLKVPPLIVGLTLVAYSTGAPELVVSIDAAIKGSGNISVGNIIGSNICNTALILGICALISPLKVNRKLFRSDLPMLIAASVVMAACCLIFRGVDRWQAGIFLAWLILYTAGNIVSGRQNSGGEEDSGGRIFPLGLALLFVAAGAAGLVAGARLFVDAAIFFAALAHISDAVIGLTVVAFGTSLPELAASVVASLKGEQDIAVGNVVGSNIFNIVGILGIAPMIRPIRASEIDLTDFSVMLGMTLLLYLFVRSGEKLDRKEGFCLFAGYLAYSVYLFVK